MPALHVPSDINTLCIWYLVLWPYMSVYCKSVRKEHFVQGPPRIHWKLEPIWTSLNPGPLSGDFVTPMALAGHPVNVTLFWIYFANRRLCTKITLNIWILSCGRVADMNSNRVLLINFVQSLNFGIYWKYSLWSWPAKNRQIQILYINTIFIGFLFYVQSIKLSSFGYKKMTIFI